MGETFTPNENINPHWSKNELLEVLNPEVGPIDSEERIIRNEWQKSIESQIEASVNLRSILNAVISWENRKPAIALWGGRVRDAQEMKTGQDRYTSREEVEAALIERIAQPSYIELNYDKSDLAEDIKPIIQSSAITQLRPNIWANEEESIDRISTVIETAVDEEIN